MKKLLSFLYHRCIGQIFYRCYCREPSYPACKNETSTLDNMEYIYRQFIQRQTQKSQEKYILKYSIVHCGGNISSRNTVHTTTFSFNFRWRPRFFKSFFCSFLPITFATALFSCFVCLIEPIT